MERNKRGRIRRLDGRQACLEGDGEHRVVSQLMETVVVVSKLLDQHLPSGWVQQVLGKGEEEHSDTIQLIPSKPPIVSRKQTHP